MIAPERFVMLVVDRYVVRTTSNIWAILHKGLTEGIVGTHCTPQLSKAFHYKQASESLLRSWINSSQNLVPQSLPKNLMKIQSPEAPNSVILIQSMDGEG